VDVVIGLENVMDVEVESDVAEDDLCTEKSYAGGRWKPAADDWGPEDDKVEPMWYAGEEGSEFVYLSSSARRQDWEQKVVPLVC